MRTIFRNTPPQLPQSLAELQSLEVELEDRLAEVRLQQIYLECETRETINPQPKDQCIDDSDNK